MRRRLLYAAVAATPLVVAGAIYGCSGEAPIEDFCTWLGTPENCYREFHEDIGRKCGAKSADGGTDVQGAFAARAPLDICILSKGGQVAFDPPIDLTKLPLTAPVTMKIAGSDGSACGTVVYEQPFSFTLTVNPPPDAGGGTGGGSASASPTGAGGDQGENPLASGVFSASTPAGRDILDVTCPNETHHFDRLQVGACPQYASVQPQMNLEIDPGGVQKKGFVRLSINYPPPDDTDITHATATTPTPADVVTYFECVIPAAPLPCQDGVKDGLETDIDCGGAAVNMGCPPRCQQGQACLCDSDCGAGICSVDPKTGARKCSGMADGGAMGFACDGGG